MIGAKRKDGARSQYRCVNGVGAKAVVCHHSATAPIVEKAVLSEVTTLLDTVTSQRRDVLAALNRAWVSLQRQDVGADVAKRVTVLEHEAGRARDRIRNAALLLIDGALDKAGYELARDHAQADLEAATRELDRLQATKPEQGLPPLADVLRTADSWNDVLRGSDVMAHRDVLAALIDHIVLVRVGWRAYDAQITWTPLGDALRQGTRATQAA